MGLKTNKTTNTSRLKCQYVGSFAVKDGERKLASSEQTIFVVEKLKSCKKKLIQGTPVFLEISPDGVKVLAEDVKTVKMVHPLRRISYATAETSNSLFAYVSHQRGTDMEVVCHTFLTKKKDHAEALSAVLGKLFKQTFAYTLQRRDKIDEVAQKRGNNRRWAKQQIGEGHSTAHTRNANPPRSGAGGTKEPRGQNPAAPQQAGAPFARTSAEPQSATAPSPTSPTRTNPMNGVSGSLQSQPGPVRSVDSSQGPTSPSAWTGGPRSSTAPSPFFPTRANPMNDISGSLQNQPGPVRSVDPSQGPTSPSAWTGEPRSSTAPSPFFPTRANPMNDISGSLQNQPGPVRSVDPSQGPTSPSPWTGEPRSATAPSPFYPTRANPMNDISGLLQNQPGPAWSVDPSQGPTSPSAWTGGPRSATTPSPFFPTRTNPTNGVPGSLQNQPGPARSVDPSEGPTFPSPWTGEPSSPKREIPSSPSRRSPVDEAPPPLPNRNNAMDNARSLPNQSGPVGLHGPSKGYAVDPRWTNEPGSPTERENPSSPTRSHPSNVAPFRPPAQRRVSDVDVRSRFTEAGSVLGGPSEEEARVHRKFSAPPDLSPPPLPPPNANVRSWKGSSPYTEEVAPIWLDANAHSRSLQAAAAVLLAGAADTPPPLPRRRGESVDRRDSTAAVQEEVIDVEEDERLKRKVTAEPRASLTLEDEDWYIPGVSREIVSEMLETSDLGTFFVRDSQSQPGCYALTMKVLKGPKNPSGFGNYLIMPMDDGFTLQGFDSVFEDISTLIRHHSSYEDGLPCLLLLAGSNPLFHDANGYLVEFMDEEDETYSSLSNCSSMFRELQMNGNTPW